MILKSIVNYLKSIIQSKTFKTDPNPPTGVDIPENSPQEQTV